jgi:hypothetical protein
VRSLYTDGTLGGIVGYVKAKDNQVLLVGYCTAVISWILKTVLGENPPSPCLAMPHSVMQLQRFF